MTESKGTRPSGYIDSDQAMENRIESPVTKRINILRGDMPNTTLLMTMQRPRIADGLSRRFYGAWSPSTPLDSLNPRLSDIHDKKQYITGPTASLFDICLFHNFIQQS